MWSITFLVFGPMCMVHEDSMTLLLAVFALRDTRVYICFINGNNMASDAEVSINEHLSIRTTLRIPNVNLDNHYIRLW